jgi:transporter family protein
MGWLAYVAATIGLWTLWGFLAKIASNEVGALQATFVFGLAAAIVGTLAFVSSHRDAQWSLGSAAITVMSAACGALGLITYYFALERGKASIVVPLIGSYPVMVILLSVLFLGERLQPIQAAGIVCAVVGVVLVSIGS